MTSPSIKEAFTQVLASLAAAISILDRTPRSKKAVASDTMFDISLNDYRKALEAGRSALATLQPSGERREAIARIIDPRAFADFGEVYVFNTRERRYFAFAKADQILASGLVQDEAGWRDISTAPKDGTEILLFTHHEADEYLDESFDAVQIGWWDDGNHAPGSVFHRDAGWHQQKIGVATDWKPLPTPPIRSARDGGGS